MANRFYSIFKGGSKTYFYSSIFFPSQVKRNVFILYSFVRKADDFVDTIPQEVEEFRAFCREYMRAKEGGSSSDKVINAYVQLERELDFPDSWTKDFLASMERDIGQSTYETLPEVLEYIYGSAEVIGLMMARILGLPRQSYPQARLLGRAMQYINFIRDIDEDNNLGRCYFPQEELDEYNLRDLSEKTARQQGENFQSFISHQLQRYRRWQKEAEGGFAFIPKRFLIPIRTASEMYKWTGKVIGDNPLVVFERKVKPSIPRIVSQIIWNGITL